MTRRLLALLARFGCQSQAERMFIERRFRERLGRSVRWDNPRTFNEKIQWLKMHYRNPRLPDLAGKVGVRHFVRDTIGDDYVMPALGIYDHVDSLLTELPSFPDEFIVKASHASGWNMIVRDKRALGRQQIRRLRKWLRRSYYYRSFEWVYRPIKPRLVVEPLLETRDGNHEPNDYKVFCYNGTPRWIQVDVDRHHNHMRSLFTTDWTPLDVALLYPRYSKPIDPPSRLDEILHVAGKLSQQFPFVRVDTYCEDRVRIGEMTFFPGSGFEPFMPEWGDELFGEDLKLVRYPGDA